MLHAVGGTPEDRKRAMELIANVEDAGTSAGELRSTASVLTTLARYLEGADRVAVLTRAAAALSTAYEKGKSPKDLYNLSQLYRSAGNRVESRKCLQTLLEAVALVVLVVILFLQTWRASVIPLVAVPVSIVGTFAVLHLFGFSINALTLFGLVLAIGIVVDDAIVVVENVERNLREGLSPRDAAHETMDEVGNALIGIALVLSAVFIPAAFIPGISGEFFRQFAVTITAATIISLITSLAFLSVRSPRNTGWRISPLEVHSVNFTSPTSLGLTQVVLASSGTFSAMGFVLVMSGTIRACRDLSDWRSKPVPARPT